jgi:DNA processing protein
MASTPGCALLTDYPPGTAPLAIHFLRRNRIIAGLSRSTILIESKLKGGGMATCRLAFSYNRDVYALPGRIDDLRSQGCNCLIREKIAEPITSVDTLMSSLGLKSISRRGRESFMERLTDCYGKTIPADKIGRMNDILQSIRAERGITLEEICRKTKMGYGQVSEMTGMLEIEGFICIDLLQRCSINYKNV